MLFATIIASSGIANLISNEVKFYIKVYLYLIITYYHDLYQNFIYKPSKT